jgi:hypothetical protein
MDLVDLIIVSLQTFNIFSQKCTCVDLLTLVCLEILFWNIFQYKYLSYIEDIFKLKYQ